MSTRCHIVIRKENCDDVFVYHHFDGYPDGVGSELVDFLKEYEGEWIPKNISSYLSNKDSMYEIDNDIHGDEEYIYEINCDDMTLKCYAADYYDLDDCPGDEIVIPGNIDFSMKRKTILSPEKQYPSIYFDTLTKVVCAMIPIVKQPTTACTLVGYAKNVVDEMFKTIE